MRAVRQPTWEAFFIYTGKSVTRSCEPSYGFSLFRLWRSYLFCKRCCSSGSDWMAKVGAYRAKGCIDFMGICDDFTDNGQLRMENGEWRMDN